MLGQLVQDVGGRRDRVGTEEQRQAGTPGGRDQPIGQRGVAGDVPVDARRHLGRLDLVLHRERLGGLAVVPAGPEGRLVRLHDLGVLGELGLEERHRAFGWPVVQPGQQAEREHVLRPLGLLPADVETLQRLDRHRRDRQGVQLVAGQGAVLERAGLVADLAQVALGELIGVGDDVRTARQVAEVGLEGRRVHGHEDVGGVARRQDVMVGEVHLEAGNPRKRSGRGPDLGREVGQRRQVVAERRRFLGEPVAGELHAVTRVAREPDDDAI